MVFIPPQFLRYLRRTSRYSGRTSGRGEISVPSFLRYGFGISPLPEVWFWGGVPRGMPGVPQGGGNISKTMPQEAGKSKTVPQEGWKIWGPPVRPSRQTIPQERRKFQNHTSGRVEPKFLPLLRYGLNTSRYAANTSKIPEV